MVFNYAHDFYIHQLTAVDGPSKELNRLLDAACPGAGHRSAERDDAPKCHPDTRKAVLRDIMSWVDSTDSKEPLMWLSGPAGAGKSSIAQTVCERCDKEHKLLASFFFSRSAVGTGRDDGNRLVPTIAVQLAIAIPETKVHIFGMLEKDPLLLTYSIEEQMQKLVFEPLAAALTTMTKKDKIPYLVVIDGLDECLDRSMQAKIMAMFAAIAPIASTRIRCFIASRPELEIRNSFDPVNNTRIVLDHHYNPDGDIRVYLQSEFSLLKRKDTLKSDLSQDSNWPTSTEIDWLVKKSSGQFIYASTIMKYLKDPRGNPRFRLRAILNRRTSEDVNEEKYPYSALDALYKLILDTAASNLQRKNRCFIIIFQILLFGRFRVEKLSRSRNKISLRRRRTVRWNISNLECFLSTTSNELELLFSDLRSILYIPERNSEESIRFHHASLGDFLKDSSRSGQFHIDEKRAHKDLAQRCFLKLLGSGCRSYDDRNEKVVLKHCRHIYMFHVLESEDLPLVVYCFIRAKLMGTGIKWRSFKPK